MSTTSEQSRKPSRRTVLAAAGATLTASIASPTVLRAQVETVKIGLHFPITGPISVVIPTIRAAAEIAVQEINEEGGIKALGGAKLEPIFADSQSRPEIGASEVDRLHAAGVSAIIGGQSSAIILAASQTAARHNLLFLADSGASDLIVSRGLPNTFRFTSGAARFTEGALTHLAEINEAAGRPCRTVMIVHEDSAFGTSMGSTMSDMLPRYGFEIVEKIAHGTPTRDFSNIVARMKSAQPDIIIPSNYYNEFVLMLRTMRQQRVRPKMVYSCLGGATSNTFVKANKDLAQYVMDTNHWYDLNRPRTRAFLERMAKATPEFNSGPPVIYSCIRLVADAIERAGTADRGKIIEAMASSTFDDHVMPYGPTKFVNGQNQGAQPVTTQIFGDDISLVYPKRLAARDLVFPMPPQP